MEYIKLVAYIVFLVTIISFVSLAPWVPTKKSDRKRVKDIVQLRPGERFLEMGSGTASVSLFLAKHHPDSFVTGVELSPVFYLIGKIRVLLSTSQNIEILYGNALNKDLKNYDVIYAFGLPETVTKKVFPKIKGIKNKNFRFISYCFKMTNDYFKEKKYKGKGEYAIYEYKLP